MRRARAVMAICGATRRARLHRHPALAVAAERSGVPAWLVRLGARLPHGARSWRIANGHARPPFRPARARKSGVDAECSAPAARPPGRWSIVHGRTPEHRSFPSGAAPAIERWRKTTGAAFRLTPRGVDRRGRARADDFGGDLAAAESGSVRCARPTPARSTRAWSPSRPIRRATKRWSRGSLDGRRAGRLWSRSTAATPFGSTSPGSPICSAAKRR